jgi:hypothetical protein
MKKLKPLSQKPLYSQFYHIFGENYNWNQDRLDRKTVKGHVLDTETGDLYALATEEEETAYKAKKERVLKKLKERAAHKYDHHPIPIIDYNNPERWKEGLKTAKDDMSKAVEMCEEAYWHFLECVPPKVLEPGAYVCGEPYTHNSKGEPVYLCGIQGGKRYFAQYGTVKQFKNRELFKSNHI